MKTTSKKVNSTQLARDDMIFRMELQAAEESISTGLYTIWRPNPSVEIPESACDDIKLSVGQCCRIGSSSLCKCGHSLMQHKQIKRSKNGSYIKPPNCLHCNTCREFSYSPSYPEECGQWWLRRRPDFNVETWRLRVRLNPTEYCCIGCNLKLIDHESWFETRLDRIQRNAPVDEAYKPLSSFFELPK